MAGFICSIFTYYSTNAGITYNCPCVIEWVKYWIWSSFVNFCTRKCLQPIVLVLPYCSHPSIYCIVHTPFRHIHVLYIYILLHTRWPSAHQRRILRFVPCITLVDDTSWLVFLMVQYCCEKGVYCDCSIRPPHYSSLSANNMGWYTN